jgi:hypothetical protein
VLLALAACSDRAPGTAAGETVDPALASELKSSDPLPPRDGSNNGKGGVHGHTKSQILTRIPADSSW